MEKHNSIDVLEPFLKPLPLKSREGGKENDILSH